VSEFRRWQTEIGNENSELKYALKQAKEEAKRFRYTGRKMQVVLEKIEPFLENINKGLGSSQGLLPELLLAIKVVCGKVPDWGNVFDEWFKDCDKPLFVRTPDEQQSPDEDLD
jgi:hypothetical protein